MEDKTFELLTKMYGEFSDRFDDVGKDIKILKNDVKDLKNDVIRIENKLDTNSKALFDGYNQTYEKLLVVEKKVDGLSDKVDKQEVEIKVIKGGKA